MKQWKEQVIESENTKKQKIHNFMAINHRRNTMKYRVFLVWSQRKFKRKAMNTIVSHMSRCLNEKIIQKWRNYVYYKSFKIEEVKNYLITFHKNLTFQKLKGYYLQEKIIKSFQKKKIFSKWKEGFVFRRIYWPSKLKDFNLKKKVFKAFIENKIMKINKSKIQQYLKIFHKRKMFKIFLKECVKMMALKKKTEYLIMTREIRIKKKLLKILSTNRLKKKLREKQMKIAIKFHARKKFNIYERSEENIFRNENLFFKVFSFLKTNLYRKKVNDTIFERFILLRERKMKKQLFNVWYEKHIKLFEKNRKIPNLYEIDLGKYQTPKFQIPHITFLKESVSSNLNKSSNSFWLKQYEENEKYMNELLMDKK